jgi:hypothetical protein
MGESMCKIETPNVRNMSRADKIFFGSHVAIRQPYHPTGTSLLRDGISDGITTQESRKIAW